MSLLLGIVAAFAWGVHDIFVRFVSQRTTIFAALLTVLLVGLVLQGITVVILGKLEPIRVTAIWQSVGSGIAFTIAGLSLYRALGIGPIRLAAPIIGSYPILSFGWAAVSGQPVSSSQWLAVLAVVAGVSLVAYFSDRSQNPDQKKNRLYAILWSLAAALGFATTFALGQAASHIAADLPVILVTRLAAVLFLILIMLAMRVPFRPARNQWPLLAAMGLLDAVALASVLSAGGLPNPEFAAVTSSMFGMITIVLAWFFLKEPMTRNQWLAAIIAFSGIGYLAI